MIRAFRYPLKPSQAQAETMVSWLGLCQQLYNAALEQRRDAWSKGVSLSLYDQQKELTVLRTEDPRFGAMAQQVARSALRRLDRAFKAFFERRRTGNGYCGYPRFRSSQRYDSFEFGPSGPDEKRFVIEGDRILIPRLGFVKFNRYRDFRGTPLEVRVSKDVAAKWWVSIVCDLGATPSKVAARNAVGIDLGLKTFAVFSDNTEVTKPSFSGSVSAASAKQSAFATKKKGSKRREKAFLEWGRARIKETNQRLNFCRELAKEVVGKFDLIAHEDLDIANMLQGEFASAIHNSWWRTFLYCLSCKAEEAGKTVVAVDPRGTSQRCSRCQQWVSKGLDVRVHSCPSCGLQLDRDHNAALNILDLGRRSAALPAETSNEVTLVSPQGVR